MNPETRDKIMEWHSKGLTQYYIATKLKMPIGVVEGIIETEVRKDHSSLFRGG